MHCQLCAHTHSSTSWHYIQSQKAHLSIHNCLPCILMREHVFVHHGSLSTATVLLISPPMLNSLPIFLCPGNTGWFASGITVSLNACDHNQRSSLHFSQMNTLHCKAGSPPRHRRILETTDAVPDKSQRVFLTPGINEMHWCRVRVSPEQ